MNKKHKLDLQLFAEDPKNEDPNQVYLDKIKDLQENTVPKSQYEELKEQNKTLLENVINGNALKKVDPEVEDKPDIKQLRDDLYGGKKDLNNLEYWEKTLELRKAVMAEGKADPFVAIGKDVQPTQADFDTAQRVADTVEECIKLANGDSKVFTQEFDSRVYGGIVPNKK